LSRHAGNDRRRWGPFARRLTSLARSVCAAWLVALCSAVSLAAAPPGAQRMDSARFTVLYYPADSLFASTVLRAAASRDTFPALPRSLRQVTIMIAPNAQVFREWIGPTTSRWAAAVAFVEQHRVVVQGGHASGDTGDPLQVLRHELAHMALYDYLGTLAPRWFEEGYASFAADEERTEGFLSANAALLFRRMPSLVALDSMLASPRGTDARAGYALALRAVTDLAAIDRERGLQPLLVAWRERGSFDLAMRRAYAETADRFEARWQQRTRWQFAFLAVAADSVLGGVPVVLILFPLYRRQHRARQVRLAAMRASEADLDRDAQGRAVDSIVRSMAPDPRPGEPDA
jgi:hypothetical protein